jgi:hypothetical protein
MLTVIKLTSARLIGKDRPISCERRSKSPLRRSRDGRDVGVPSQRGHNFVEGFLRPPSALQVQVEKMSYHAERCIQLVWPVLCEQVGAAEFPIGCALKIISVASCYLTFLIANVGVTNTNTQLLLNITCAITGWIPAMIGAQLHDVVDRRKMLLGCAMGMAICLSIAAGTASGYVQMGVVRRCRVLPPPSSTPSDRSLPSPFTSMQLIYPGEILSNDMRAKGIGVFQFTANCTSFVNTFAAPMGLNSVGAPAQVYQLLLTPEVDRLLVLHLFRLLGPVRRSSRQKSEKGKHGQDRDLPTYDQEQARRGSCGSKRGSMRLSESVTSLFARMTVSQCLSRLLYLLYFGIIVQSETLACVIYRH